MTTGIRTMDTSPFDIVYGRALTLPATMAIPSPQLEATAMTEQLDAIRTKLLHAQALMELHPSVNHSVLTFSEGEQVF
jgi:hypothetical protein